MSGAAASSSSSSNNLRHVNSLSRLESRITMALLNIGDGCYGVDLVDGMTPPPPRVRFRCRAALKHCATVLLTFSTGGVASANATQMPRQVSKQVAIQIQTHFIGLDEHQHPGTIHDLRKLLESCGLGLSCDNIDATWEYLDRTVWTRLRDRDGADRAVIGGPNS